MFLKELLRKKEVKIFLTIWFIFIFFISNYGGNYMANSMLYQTMSIIDRGDFIIDDYVKEGCKESGCDHSFYDGYFYSGEPPGNSIIALPIYFIFKPIFKLIIPEMFLDYSHLRLSVIFLNILATIFIPSLLSALLGVLIYKILKYFTKNKKKRLIVTFLFSFGTLFFMYSTGYYSRVMASFFLFLSFYLLFKMKKDGVKNHLLFFSGLSAASAISFEYISSTIILFLLFLYLLTFLRDKRIFIFILGAIIPIILLAIYHYTTFGSFFSTPYHNRARAGARAAYSTTSMGELTYPNLNCIFGLSFSFNKGFLIYMPILLLSFYGIYLGFKKKKFFVDILFILLIFLATFFYNSSLSISWEMNCCFGPRALIPMIPFLILPLIFVIKKHFKLVLGFGLISILINFLPALYGRTVLWAGGCMDKNAIFNQYVPLLFKRGLTNYTLNLIKFKIYDIPIWTINILFLIGVGILGLIIYKLWKY